MMLKCSDFKFVPGIGLGAILFGPTNLEFNTTLKARVYETNPKTDDVSYEMEEFDVIFSTLEGEIYGITSWDCFFYKETNFIGLTFSEVKELIFPNEFVEAELLELENGIQAQLYDCDELGLGICLEDKKVTFASCHVIESSAD